MRSASRSSTDSIPTDSRTSVDGTSSGEPAADASNKRLKVERLYLGDKTYDLYPERD